MFSLKGKLALVTGGSRGLGAAICRCFAEAGADAVAVNYANNEKAAARTVNEVKAFGAGAIAVQADVSKEGDVVRMFETILKTYGRVDIVVNNAGVYSAGHTKDETIEAWNRTIGINLTGTFLCTKHALPIMEKQMGGRIINIASGTAYKGSIKGGSAYGVSKAGVIAMAKGLVKTEAKYNITLNCVAPGLIITDLAETTGLSGEDYKKAGASIPLGLGKAEEIGYACVYIASDEARWMTGNTIDINGGIYVR